MNLLLYFVIIIAEMLVFYTGYFFGKEMEKDNSFLEVSIAKSEAQHYKVLARKYNRKAENLELKLKKCEEKLESGIYE